MYPASNPSYAPAILGFAVPLLLGVNNCLSAPAALPTRHNDGPLTMQRPVQPSGATNNSPSMQKPGLMPILRQMIAEASSAASTIDNPYTKADVLSKIVAAQAIAGDADAAKANAANIDNSLYRCEALCNIAASQGRLGDPKGAKQTLVEAKSLASTISRSYDGSQALRHIAAAQAHSGDVNGVAITLAAARAIAGTISSHRFKSDVFAGIASVEAETGNYVDAQRTAAAIVDSDWKANALRDIAECQARSGDKLGALRTLADAVSIAESLDDGLDADSSVLCENISLREIAIAQARYGDAKAAKTTAAKIIDRGYRASALSSIAVAQALSNDKIGAMQSFDEATTSAESIPGLVESIQTGQNSAFALPKVQALTDVAIAQAQYGDIAGAKQTARDVGEGQLADDARLGIAVAQARRGDYGGAKITAAAIVGLYVQCKALDNIAAAQVKSGDIAGARITLLTIKQQTATVNDNLLKSDVLADTVETILQGDEPPDSRSIH